MTTYTVTWDEWLRIKPLGITLGDPTIIPAPEPTPNQAGEPPEIIFPLLSATEAAMDELKKTSKPDFLRSLLDEMYKTARANVGQALRRELKRGLRIDLIVGLDGKLRLQISRQGANPSSQEWKIVCNAFPVELAERMPERFDHKDRSYLRAAWLANDPANPDGA